ncbi:response regulator transcription factor [Methylocella sp. CPCC 101449]|uniref:response regulator transcription factor n=1 Tax=Methylocella sp. CPCC 101449 TaxID=2987531 RepID=UPI00288DA593|nr:response regulator transcription factor [Methylocella sp. CPCC 101449]MDT2020647.1 response regulator transcription factor [Methylocella sp. CPCC 101449]
MSTPSSAQAGKRILCVEDDAEIARMLAETLDANGFSAAFVGSAKLMDQRLLQDRYDLILLDIMLPGEDGLSICRRLRASSNIPIIMVTARGEEIDRILGLELGADDYITKPFSSRELVARVRALLRRTETFAISIGLQSRTLSFAGWSINPMTRELHDPTGLQITLTSVEFDLLLALCRNAGKLMSREQLIELVHGGLANSIERSIDVHISRIRQKIEPDPKGRSMIKTIRLGGYLFSPKVDVV